MTLSWKEPHKDGGAPITGYYVEKRTTYNPRWSAVNRQPTKLTRIEISDLSEGRDYEFRVMAENEVGLSEPSEKAGPVKAQEPYGKRMASCHY